ncbi:hypothetical protein QBC38DRAFT_505475 [Podospora fimiseda]|uniref:Uncharacterized protein n=1 Tax=Podospora fimiseda TaxID=252190 RepID=A0AAN7BEF3_9PEZI|nr:hypothetical protein QBC38DRAFT_505475 [Podospora fimiseda]
MKLPSATDFLFKCFEKADKHWRRWWNIWTPKIAEDVQDIERQLRVGDERTGKGVHKIFRRCEAPQLIWVYFENLDGTKHVTRAAISGARMTREIVWNQEVYRLGRPQIYFRTVQELTIPDPLELQSFTPCSFESAVAYNPLTVVDSIHPDEISIIEGEMTLAELQKSLKLDQESMSCSQGWMDMVAEFGEAKDVATAVESILFFGNMAFDREYNQWHERARCTLALVTLLRDLVITTQECCN